jgi:hypothetical protein
MDGALAGTNGDKGSYMYIILHQLQHLIDWLSHSPGSKLAYRVHIIRLAKIVSSLLLPCVWSIGCDASLVVLFLAGKPGCLG